MLTYIYGMTYIVKSLLSVIILVVLAGALVISACGPTTKPVEEEVKNEEVYLQSATASIEPSAVSLPLGPAKEPKALLREVKVYKDLIPRGQHARKYQRKMTPRYITVHSTQNYSAGADAWKHSLALKNGKLKGYKRKGGNRIGYLVWHYTIDENVVVQHLPTNEQGEHADFDGPGNNYSIGVEMCEHLGNSRERTVERTAKLIAYLMYEKSIPLRSVVPHYHWERKGLPVPHKNCPHFLLDNGRPGAKWDVFLAKVKKYHDDITVPVEPEPLEEMIEPLESSQPYPPVSPNGYLYGY